MVLGCLPMSSRSDHCSLCGYWHENLCRKCNSDCKGNIVQQFCNRKVTHWYIKCHVCDGRSNFTSEREAKRSQCLGWNDIEVIDDRCELCLGQGCPNCEPNPCERKRCTTPHHLVETHHWAPKKNWKLDADLWPTSRLCKFHHNEWHKVMRNDNT